MNLLADNLATLRSGKKQTEKKENLGTRLNNPLNIRYVKRNRWMGLHIVNPCVKGFCHFVGPVFGYRAAIVLIKNYMKRYGRHTPRQIVERWAPSSENLTELYIAAVCGRSLLDPDTPITPDGPELSRLVAAMARQETGAMISAEEIENIRLRFSV